MKQLVTVRKQRRVATVDVVTFDGIELPDDGVELLTEAVECDGYFTFVLIHDLALRKALEDKGYVRTSNKGGSYGTAKLRKVLPKLVEALDK